MGSECEEAERKSQHSYPGHAWCWLNNGAQVVRACWLLLPQFTIDLVQKIPSQMLPVSHCYPSTQTSGAGHRVSRSTVSTQTRQFGGQFIDSLLPGNLCPGSTWTSIPGSGNAPPSVWEGSSQLLLLCLYPSKCARSSPGDFTICQIKWFCLICITPRCNLRVEGCASPLIKDPGPHRTHQLVFP